MNQDRKQIEADMRQQAFELWRNLNSMSQTCPTPSACLINVGIRVWWVSSRHV